MAVAIASSSSSGSGRDFAAAREAHDDLHPVERLALARSLDDDERRLFEPLVGREAPAARQALASPANGGAVVGRP